MNVALLYSVLYWAWIISEAAILIVTRTKKSSGEVQDRGSLRILWLVIFVSVSIGTWIGKANAPTIFGGAHWVRTLSVVVLAIGLAVRWSAIVTLGRSFSVNVAIHATQKMQTGGLFRLMRHPSYTGLILVFVAIGLHTRNWMGLAVLMIPTTAALLYRIHVEETALRGAFGQEYVDYSKATKRLVPGIY
jgi:protein-S-isoprenylcysteine O-methyltransferase Ste14